MRIVFLNPSGELGGAETALLEMLAGLREARPAWNLALAASAAGPLLSRAADLGVQSTELRFPHSLARLGEWGSTPRGFWTRAVRRRASWRSRPHHLLRRTSQKALLRKPSRCRAYQRNEDASAWRRAMPSRAEARVAHARLPRGRPLSGRLLASARVPLRCHRGEFRKRCRGNARAARPAPCVHAIYNAVDLGRFHPEGPQLDLDALCGLQPFAPEGIRIGLVATFARWKGHEVFLNALSRVRSSIPVRGYVIGGPIYQTSGSQYSATELRALAASRGLGDKLDLRAG